MKFYFVGKMFPCIEQTKTSFNKQWNITFLTQHLTKLWIVNPTKGMYQNSLYED